MAPGSVRSLRSILSGHNSASSTSLASYQPSISRVLDDAALSSSTPWQPVQSLEDLPEELILSILSHMEDKELLLSSGISRYMNRLAVQQLLSHLGIRDPTAVHCKIVLSAQNPDDHADALTALLHSVHIKDIKKLDIRHLSYTSAHSLVHPLRRTLRLLRNLNSVGEMTLNFPSYFGGDVTAVQEKYLKETVSVFEEVLNEIILKSCKRLYLRGSRRLLADAYQPRGQDVGPSQPVPAIPGSRPIFRRFIGAKDYLDRQKEKKIDDTIVQDDLRYSRTTIAGSRIFARCTPVALSRTHLTHINLNTVDFLRPPLSQWLFPMLRGSPIRSMSFDFHSLSTTWPDPQEYDFMLGRLAAVVPNLQSIHINGLKEPALQIFTKFMNKFSNLTSIIIETPKRETTIAAIPHLHPPINNVNSNFNSTPHVFAPTLRQIDGPVQYLTWFFKTACQSGAPEEPTYPGTRNPITLADLVPRFPSLTKVHIDYYCVRGVAFELSVLAEAITSVQEAIKSTTGLMPTRTKKVTIEVHLKFDQEFRGLLPSWSKGETGVARLPLLTSVLRNVLTDLEGPSAVLDRWIEGLVPDGNAAPPESPSIQQAASTDVEPPTEDGDENSEPVDDADPDATSLGVLATVQKVFLALPGSRKDIIRGKFNMRILAAVTIFWGLRNLKLMSAGASATRVGEAAAQLSSAEFELFKARNPRLKKIEVL
ncbi:hypothetical protein FA13DRAFT_1726354 [Coprinellus micaceus]|uniref:F-box domain-containing protein n=1 Tax=Coprinellus micaceus TaxID=71717 RepID=A0A4Y7TSW4_COPMI|nr:hypothetical protein FA13DRAFT_1726354 [Coprinellus micaceus]